MMKTGKISETVLKRSVLKQLKTKREEVQSGAGVGEDCAIFCLGGEYLTAISVSPVIWRGENTAKYAVYDCVNNLAAGGAEPVAVTVSVLLPKQTQEAELKRMMAQIEAECAKLRIQVAGGHTEVTGAVNRPVLHMTGIGKLRREDASDKKEGKGCLLQRTASVKNMRPGQDVVASKWIGIEGTALLSEQKEEELLTKYSARFVEEAKAFDRFLSIIPEAATAVKSGVCAMHDVSEGGIFGALWEMAERAGVGLEIDWKKIPVRQETIEVCEFFEINPYELISGGCLLMAADNGYDLVRELEKEGIPAAVIGKVTDSNDRVVINEEERRYLEPPKGDELHKIL